MAPETKAKRVARAAQALHAREAELAVSYPKRLMAMLERATKFNYELTVRDSKFMLTDRDDRSEPAIELGISYSTDSQQELDELDWRVDLKEREALEAERKRLLRENALRKLTQEERLELGL